MPTNSTDPPNQSSGPIARLATNSSGETSLAIKEEKMDDDMVSENNYIYYLLSSRFSNWYAVQFGRFFFVFYNSILNFKDFKLNAF